MALPRAVHLTLLGATAVALITVQVAATVPRDRFLWSEAFDVGHAPLYGLVALAILKLLRAKGGESGGSGIRLYLLALALTVGAGVMAECIQAFRGGDVEIGDIGRDTLGATAFLLAASAFDRELSRERIRPPRTVAFLLAALLLTLAFIPLADTVVVLLRRDAAFPAICDFDASWETRFVVAREADLERTRPPEGWGRRPSDRVARMAFQNGRHPGLSIRTLHPNWTGYKQLVFEAYSELSEPVKLVFSIHDIGHDTEYHDRFNRELIIEPGANRISIPLADMQTAPRGREMDMSRMCGLVLFADHPNEPFVLYLDAFRLE